ncbi:MAG: two-component regulator propeller domain-containing protein [Bacteroidota bacterium]
MKIKFWIHSKQVNAFYPLVKWERLTWWLMPILLLLVHLSWGQRPGCWHLTDEDGLPGMTVHEIVEDEQGYIWMGTNNGLCRFDGRTFQVFSDLELKDNEILKLKRDRFGRFWVLTLAKELVCLEKDSLQQKELQAVIALDHIQAVWLAEDGLITMYYKNNQSNYTYYSFSEDGGIVKESELKTSISQAHFNAIPQVIDGHFSLVIFHLESSSFYIQLIRVIADQLRIDETRFDRSLKEHQWELLAPIDQLYITSGSQIAQIRDGRIEVVSKMVKEFYLLLYQSQAKGAWIKTGNKGVIQNKVENQEMKVQNEEMTINLNSLMRDREGNYWMGTTGDGVYLVPSVDIRYFNTDNRKLPADFVYCIYPYQGKALIGQANGFLTFFEEEAPLQSINFPKNGDIRSIVIGDQQEVIMGFDRSIVYSNDRKWEKEYVVVPDINGVKKLLLDHREQLWVAAATGVWQLNGPRNRRPLDTEFALIQSQRTYGICEDHHHRLWMGTTNGLFYRDGAQVKVFNAGEDLDNLSITSLHYAKDSSIWVATDNRGLLRIKNDQLIEQYGVQDGLTSNSCTALYDDGQRIWLGTNLGLNAIDPQTRTIQTINVKSGLPSNEISAIYAVEKKVWVGTANGLAIFPQSIMATEPPPPNILLSGITVNGKTLPLQTNYQLKYNENDLAINYTGIAYQARGKEQYRYRMLGLDTTWQLSTNRDVSYYALAPGEYIFEVQCKTLKEVLSEEPARVKFYIAPAWWQIWWIQVLLGLGILSLFGAFILWRQRNILKNERKENQLQERISELRMQALQAQMNPHFVFNTLNAIQELLLTNDNDKALDALSHFAKMIAFVFENSRKKTISLREEIQFLDHYLKLEKLRFEDRVVINFSVDMALEQQQEALNIPPLLLQPLIENAFKHGLHHSLGEGRLEVKFVPAERSALKCTITDNGVGRKVAASFTQLRDSRKRSISSLDITRERLNLFHQSTTEAEYLRISDVINEQKEVKGTRVEVWL